MSEFKLIGDKEVKEIKRQLEPLSSASWETVEDFVNKLLATREAIIKKVEQRKSACIKMRDGYEQGSQTWSWENEIVGELDIILSYLHNPQEKKC